MCKCKQCQVCSMENTRVYYNIKQTINSFGCNKHAKPQAFAIEAVEFRIELK